MCVYSDTGIGLSATDVELLFVPFQQADVGHLRFYKPQAIKNKLELLHSSIWRYRPGPFDIETTSQAYGGCNWSLF